MAQSLPVAWAGDVTKTEADNMGAKRSRRFRKVEIFFMVEECIAFGMRVKRIS
jgi:hypothetical protein